MNIFVKNFKNHLSRTILYGDMDYDKLYEEVLSFFNETENDFVIRRHLELKTEGKKNNEIFKSIKEEINHWRFKGRALSDRQLKRIIYKEK